VADLTAGSHSARHTVRPPAAVVPSDEAPERGDAGETRRARRATVVCVRLFGRGRIWQRAPSETRKLRGRVGLAARPPQTKTAHGGAGGGRLPRRTRRPSHPSGRGVPLEAAGEVHRVGAAGETTRARSAGGSHNEAVPPTDPSSGSPARVNAPGWKRASKPARPPHRVPAESPRSSLALRGSFPFTTRAVSRSFEPSLQSSLQLSLTVLMLSVSWSCLALDGIYHPLKITLSSNPTRCRGDAESAGGESSLPRRAFHPRGARATVTRT